MVRLKKGKKTFEILTHHGTVEPFREGKLGWDKVPVADRVFKNSSKGEVFTDAELIEAFETANVEEVMKQIAMKGELQTNAADRAKAVADKRKQIVQYLHKNYLNPKTKKPHPVLDLENALEVVKLRVDPDAPVDAQVKSVFSKLLEIIPLKKSEMEGKLVVPHSVLGQAQGVIRKYCQISSENYTSDGVAMQVSVVPGDYDVFIKELSSVTKGDFQFDVDGAAAAAGTDDNANNNNNNNKGGKGKGKKK